MTAAQLYHNVSKDKSFITSSKETGKTSRFNFSFVFECGPNPGSNLATAPKLDFNLQKTLKPEPTISNVKSETFMVQKPPGP